VSITAGIPKRVDGEFTTVITTVCIVVAMMVSTLEKTMVEINAYWYARGYYDGRSEGVEHGSDLAPRARSAYEQGYQAGVSDHCVLDMNDGVDKQKETV
jgi:hypothetical protein